VTRAGQLKSDEERLAKPCAGALRAGLAFRECTSIQVTVHIGARPDLITLNSSNLTRAFGVASSRRAGPRIQPTTQLPDHFNSTSTALEYPEKFDEKIHLPKSALVGRTCVRWLRRR